MISNPRQNKKVRVIYNNEKYIAELRNYTYWLIPVDGDQQLDSILMPAADLKALSRW